MIHGDFAALHGKPIINNWLKNKKLFYDAAFSIINTNMKGAMPTQLNVDSKI